MDDDDPTPTRPMPDPLTTTAVNLLDVALATESVAVSLREAARQCSGTSGVARQHILTELGGRLTQLGGVFVEAGEALKTEAKEKEPT